MYITKKPYKKLAILGKANINIKECFPSHTPLNESYLFY